MGLIRLAVIAALIYFSWRLIQKVLQNNTPREGGTQPPPSSTGKMVQCQQCKLYLPESEAVTHQHLTFCSDEHKRQYIEHSDD